MLINAPMNPGHVYSNLAPSFLTISIRSPSDPYCGFVAILGHNCCIL
jgi:hypothetical protein